MINPGIKLIGAFVGLIAVIIHGPEESGAFSRSEIQKGSVHIQQ